MDKDVCLTISTSTVKELDTRVTETLPSGSSAMSNSQSSLFGKRDQDTQAPTSSTPRASYSPHTDIDDNSVEDPKSRTLDIMNEMPNDILLEIFSHVEPIDLFHISRTTKTLRDLITGSNSMFVWKRVRQFSVCLYTLRVGMTFPYL